MNMTNGKDYCINAAFRHVQNESKRRGGIIKSASIGTNQKPCDCAFCVRERKTTELRLKGSLTRIQDQLDQSSRKNKEFEKTTKLLRLVNKDNMT